MSKKMLVIHDVDVNIFENIACELQKDCVVISPEDKIGRCIGCFGCWLKTPGICIQKDALQQSGKIFCNADEIVLITECAYGGYSPFVKTALDRCIGHMLPFFVTRKDGMMGHASRTENSPNLMVYFYGDMTDGEVTTAKKVVAHNAMNLHARKSDVFFFDDVEKIRIGVNK